MAGTLDRAVASAARDAAASGLKEPVVLLSPACASFDQFREFRGARRPIPRTGAGAAGRRADEVTGHRASAASGITSRNFSALTSWQPCRVTTRAGRGCGMASRTVRTPFGDWWWTVDRLMLAALFGLMLAGIILSLAASPPVAARLGLDPFHFVNRHILYLLPAIVVLLVTSFLSPRQISARRAGGVSRQPGPGRGDAVLRRRDQGRAALARIARRQHPAVGIPQARFRRS